MYVNDRSLKDLYLILLKEVEDLNDTPKMVHRSTQWRILNERDGEKDVVKCELA